MIISFIFLIIILFFKVLGNGEVLEFDTPKLLLSDPNSQFTSLVKQAGAGEAEHLRTLSGAPSTIVKVKKQTFNPDDELPEENDENDPLILSHRKQQ